MNNVAIGQTQKEQYGTQLSNYSMAGQQRVGGISSLNSNVSQVNPADNSGLTKDLASILGNTQKYFKQEMELSEKATKMYSLDMASQFENERVTIEADDSVSEADRQQAILSARQRYIDRAVKDLDNDDVKFEQFDNIFGQSTMKTSTESFARLTKKAYIKDVNIESQNAIDLASQGSTVNVVDVLEISEQAIENDPSFKQKVIDTNVKAIANEVNAEFKNDSTQFIVQSIDKNGMPVYSKNKSGLNGVLSRKYANYGSMVGKEVNGKMKYSFELQDKYKDNQFVKASIESTINDWEEFTDSSVSSLNKEAEKEYDSTLKATIDSKLSPLGFTSFKDISSDIYKLKNQDDIIKYIKKVEDVGINGIEATAKDVQSFVKSPNRIAYEFKTEQGAKEATALINQDIDSAVFNYMSEGGGSKKDMQTIYSAIDYGHGKKVSEAILSKYSGQNIGAEVSKNPKPFTDTKIFNSIVTNAKTEKSKTKALLLRAIALTGNNMFDNESMELMTGKHLDNKTKKTRELSSGEIQDILEEIPDADMQESYLSLIQGTKYAGYDDMTTALMEDAKNMFTTEEIDIGDSIFSDDFDVNYDTTKVSIKGATAKAAIDSTMMRQSDKNLMLKKLYATAISNKDTSELMKKSIDERGISLRTVGDGIVEAYVPFGYYGVTTNKVIGRIRLGEAQSNIYTIVGE